MAAVKPKLDPTLLVIFGITGDLAKRKLLPALYGLFKLDLLPEQFEIIGITRREISLEELLKDVELCVSERDKVCDPVTLAKMNKALKLYQMDVTNPADYERLSADLQAKEDHYGTCMNRLYYLSIPPQVFAPIVRMLDESGHNSSCSHGKAISRLLVEKPFGFDYPSAQDLITDLRASYTDDQLYRIDHYLAKETAQNILTFRFENPLLQHVWTGAQISQIVITASETIGIEDRVAFYEQTGALRDLIQSHLLQLLSLVTMEQPDQLTSGNIHAAKLELLQSISAIQPDRVATQTIRGQYQGYRDEVDNQQSFNDTFAALSLTIDSDRWRNTKVILKTGKALERKETTISVTFCMPDNPDKVNELVFWIQPNEGINLRLYAKEPGLINVTQVVDMHFDYHDSFQNLHPDAYERVLIDAIRGDNTLFATSEEVLESWRIIQHVIDEWAKNDNGLVVYQPGTAGPEITTL